MYAVPVVVPPYETDIDVIDPPAPMTAVASALPSVDADPLMFDTNT